MRIEIKSLCKQVDSLNRASVKNIWTETNYRDGCRYPFCTPSFNPTQKYYLDQGHITGQMYQRLLALSTNEYQGLVALSTNVYQGLAALSTNIYLGLVALSTNIYLGLVALSTNMYQGLVALST